jgi:hypothetical protein
MKALITNIRHYLFLVYTYLTDRGDEPLYYFIRFRVALFMMAFLFILNCATFYEMRKWNIRAKANLSYNIELLRANKRLIAENDMLADLMLSNGQIDIIRFYCDDFRKWQDRQLRNANTTGKSLTENEN